MWTQPEEGKGRPWRQNTVFPYMEPRRATSPSLQIQNRTFLLWDALEQRDRENSPKEVYHR